MINHISSFQPPPTLIESTAYLTVAYIAGSRRLLHYFPGMTRGGLFAVAGTMGLVSSTYEVLREHEQEVSIVSSINLLTIKVTLLASSIFLFYTYVEKSEACSNIKWLRAQQVPATSVTKFVLLESVVCIVHTLCSQLFVELQKKEDEANYVSFLEGELINALNQASQVRDLKREVSNKSERACRMTDEAQRLRKQLEHTLKECEERLIEKGARIETNRIQIKKLTEHITDFKELIGLLKEQAPEEVFKTLPQELNLRLLNILTEPDQVKNLTDEELGYLYQKELVQAIPEEKVNSVNERVVGFLTEPQLEHLTDPKKREALPQMRVPFIRALSTILSVSDKHWPQHHLIEERLRGLTSGRGRKLRDITSLSTMLFEGINEIFIKFGALAYGPFSVFRIIDAILIRNQDQTGFHPGNSVEGTRERADILYDILHMIYFLKKMPIKDGKNKETVKLLLKDFAETVVGHYCKTGWTSALGAFEGLQAEHCPCSNCQLRDNDDKVLLKSKLDQKIIPWKQELFKLAVVSAFGLEDCQQVHTVEYYARQLPELGVGSPLVDLNAECALGHIAKEDIKRAFLTNYARELPDFIKNLISFSGGDEEVRNLVIDIFKGLFLEESKKHQVNISTEHATHLVTNFIWDPDTYEVNPRVSEVLLHAFHHLSFNPEDALFNQFLDDGTAFSIHFDTIAAVLNRLGAQPN